MSTIKQFALTAMLITSSILFSGQDGLSQDMTVMPNNHENSETFAVKSAQLYKKALNAALNPSDTTAIAGVPLSEIGQDQRDQISALYNVCFDSTATDSDVAVILSENLGAAATAALLFMHEEEENTAIKRRHLKGLGIYISSYYTHMLEGNFAKQAKKMLTKANRILEKYDMHVISENAFNTDMTAMERKHNNMPTLQNL